jgi:hypothetical protein
MRRKIVYVAFALITSIMAGARPASAHGDAGYGQHSYTMLTYKASAQLGAPTDGSTVTTSTVHFESNSDHWVGVHSPTGNASVFVDYVMELKYQGTANASKTLSSNVTTDGMGDWKELADLSRDHANLTNGEKTATATAKIKNSSLSSVPYDPSVSHQHSFTINAP